jgi:hypothetical protein
MDPEEPWDGWEINKAETLYEFSIVTRPADPKAGATHIQSAKGGLPDGLKLADLSEALLDDAEELIDRYAALHRMRNVAEGRDWSEGNRRRLTAWQDRAERLQETLAALLTSPDQNDGAASEKERLSLMLDLQRLRDDLPVGV